MLAGVDPLLRPGAVVLMHDGVGPGALRSGCGETVSLVGPLVSRLRELGCQPSPLASAAGSGGRGSVTA